MQIPLLLLRDKYYRCIVSIHSCICHHNFTGIFLAMDFLWDYWIEIVSVGLPCMRFTFLTGIICNAVASLDWLSLPWNDYTLPCVGPVFGAAILNYLACKFDIMENNFSFLYTRIDSIYWYTFTILLFVLFDFHPSIRFLCISISQRHIPYYF